MGGAVSAGENNDDLIDNLVEADYIKTPQIIRVFRAVDRGDYYLPEHRENAYKDLAWKHGTLHLSAPCIYAEVMESLQLQPGLSFLNLGSGTGYLSTLVGLILGPQGINHGVELYPEVVEYAYQCLDAFRKNNDRFDEFELCEPTFTVGNCLLIPSGSRLYDRVYCGAACPEEHENYMKNLLCVGGVLVMPVNDQLIQVTRKSATEWDTKHILPVSFATLVQPAKGGDSVELPVVQVLSLQESCRLLVRQTLRQIILSEHPGICVERRMKKAPPRGSRIRRTRRGFNVVPMNRGVFVMRRQTREDDNNEFEPVNSDSEGEGRPLRQRRRANTDNAATMAEEEENGESGGQQSATNDPLRDEIYSDDERETLPDFLRRMRVLMDLTQRGPYWQQRADLPLQQRMEGEDDDSDVNEEPSDFSSDDGELPDVESSAGEQKTKAANGFDHSATGEHGISTLTPSAVITIQKNPLNASTNVDNDNRYNAGADASTTPIMSWSDGFLDEAIDALSNDIVNQQDVPVITADDDEGEGRTVSTRNDETHNASFSTSATSGFVSGCSVGDRHQLESVSSSLPVGSADSHLDGDDIFDAVHHHNDDDSGKDEEDSATAQRDGCVVDALEQHVAQQSPRPSRSEPRSALKPREINNGHTNGIGKPKATENGDCASNKSGNEGVDNDAAAAAAGGDGEGANERLTMRKCMHEKIALLPIPASLQRYLMYQRL